MLFHQTKFIKWFSVKIPTPCLCPIAAWTVLVDCINARCNSSLKVAVPALDRYEPLAAARLPVAAARAVVRDPDI
jgi:hypothetical protein